MENIVLHVFEERIRFFPFVRLPDIRMKSRNFKNEWNENSCFFKE